jgi:hypothetical protein
MRNETQQQSENDQSDNALVDLVDLLREPREPNADLIVCRIRQAMADIAEDVVPGRLVLVSTPVVDSDLTDVGSLQIGWWPLRSFARVLLRVLRTWERTGAPEHARALKEAATGLLTVWRATLEGASLNDRFGELGVDSWEGSWYSKAMSSTQVSGVAVKSSGQRAQRSRTMGAGMRDGSW